MTRRRSALIPLLIGLTGFVAAAIGMALLSVVLDDESSSSSCSSSGGPTAAIVLGPAGSGVRVGATEYGGPGDPSSGDVGSSGANLLQNPDSYAELGGDTFQTANAMGGLPYMTPLRITWGAHSAVAYKRDIGFGGGPIDGYPRVIDLWWQFAGDLGIPYENGMWSGPVNIERAPNTGAANLLGEAPSSQPSSSSCSSASGSGLPITRGPRATLLSSGQAAAPADAPAAVKGIIAAGNQIVGKPYVYGGGHGLPLSEIAPSYDCSSSVAHLLWGGGLLPATGDMTSGEMESWGLPGPGHWVTIYASAAHVFMYVAGLRWDTHNAAGPDDGTTGIGWHPLIRSSAGFVARHPAGL